MKHYDDLGSGEEWGTPPGVFDPLADAIGGFDLDPASGAEPKPYADTRYTVADDGLATPWFGDVVINPPYGRVINRAWGERVVDQAARDDVDTVTALVPASTGTEWFGDTYATADALTCLHNRLTFHDAADERDGDVKDATFGSVIASFGDFPDAYFDAMNDLRNIDDTAIPTTTYRRG